MKRKKALKERKFSLLPLTMKLKWKKLSTRVMSFYKLRKLLSFEVDIEAATDSVP